MKKANRLLPWFALLVAFWAPPAQGGAPPAPFFNGFEKNTNGWFDGGDRAIIRRQSGYINGVGGYANGIQSADGNWHARLTDTTSCTQNCDGPFTRWGGYSATFPSGGYVTQFDIYLDVQWAAAHNDFRFDWISAINTNQSTGTCPDTTAPPCFLRDFVFNASTQLPFVDLDPNPHFIIQTSTNSTRSGANPHFPCPSPNTSPNTCRPATVISTSGWYTFRHTFRDEAGTLAIDFDIFAHGSNTPITHQTIYADPTSTVGGNRYGWFSNEEIPDLAIDNSLRTGVCHEGDGDGEVEDNNSHSGHFHFHKNSCDGSKDDVEEDDDSSGSHFQSTSTDSATFTPADNSQTLTMVGTGLHNGLPVGFTMVAVDNQGLAPAVFTLILSDGYVITGNTTTGSILVQ